MSVMLRSAFSDLHDARFREIFSDKFEQFPVVYDQVLQMKDSDRQYEKYSSVSAHGLLVETAESGTPTDDSRIQGYDLQLTNRKFTMKARISWENLKDDQFNELEKEATMLARAAKRTPDVYASDLFNRGFVTTDRFGNSLLAADGVRLFSTLHKLNSEDGTTVSNASATGITLTEANLETAMLAVNHQKNPKSILAGARATHLVVPTNMRKEALIITGSDKRSGTGDNDLNVYKGGMEAYGGGMLQVVVWPEMGSGSDYGSATAWFLLDKDIHELLFQWRERPMLHPVEFNQDNMSFEYLMHERFEFGMVDWRGTWGSKGDGAAYSS